MRDPALKREVSNNKMLNQRNPGLRRTDVVSNSLAGSVSDAAKEFSRAPEMPSLEIFSQPGMLMQQTESAVAFEKLKGFTDAHGWGQLNEKVDVINSDVKLVNLAMLPISNFSDEILAVHPDAIELHRVHGILALPHEVESILPKGMLSRFQVHFSSPIAHANIVFNSGGLGSNPSLFNHSEILNFEGSDSSQNLKVWVPSLRM
jgi:hypothetical protein